MTDDAAKEWLRSTLAAITHPDWAEIVVDQIRHAPEGADLDELARRLRKRRLGKSRADDEWKIERAIAEGIEARDLQAMKQAIDEEVRRIATVTHTPLDLLPRAGEASDPVQVIHSVADYPSDLPLYGLAGSILMAGILEHHGGFPKVAEASWRAIDEQRADRSTRHWSLHEQASEYARLGVPVFPVEERGKRPRTRNGFKDATTRQHQIAEWWLVEGWGQSNIAAPTGIAFDVIDVDGPRGCDALARSGRWGELMEQAIGVVSTPRRGGLHIYVPPSGRRNEQSRLDGVEMPGVDVRGIGGYVLLPGSVTDEHGPGREYVWAQPLDLR